MTVIIDKFGRIIIPKKLRKILGLEAGKKLSLEITADGFLVKPEEDGFVKLIKKGKWVVGESSSTTTDVDIVGLIHQVREDRTNHFLKDIL